MSFPIYDKDPNSVLDWVWDWTAWLGTSEQISSIQVITAPSGLTVDSNNHTTTTATAWLSGGTAGTIYTVTMRIITNQTRTEDSSIRIRIKDK